MVEKLEKHKKQFLKSINNKKEKVYLIHHMHHFKNGSSVKHELHHCFLFSQKNMRGKKYPIIHKTDKSNVLHCIDAKFEGIFYDHKNNNFKVISRKLKGKIVYEIKF